MLALVLLVQAQAQTQALPPPDIQIGVRVEAREVRVERKGEASLTVRAEPDNGSTVASSAPRAASGQRLRDVEVQVEAEARIAPPATPARPPR